VIDTHDYVGDSGGRRDAPMHEPAKCPWLVRQRFSIEWSAQHADFGAQYATCQDCLTDSALKTDENQSARIPNASNTGTLETYYLGFRTTHVIAFDSKSHHGRSGPLTIDEVGENGRYRTSRKYLSR
jgi:hypothetical protein